VSDAVRCPCSDFMDMLRRLINCCIIIIIIRVKDRDGVRVWDRVRFSIRVRVRVEPSD